jgi:broad specificity phosphatase PhoE
MSNPVRRLYVLRRGEVAYFDEEGNALEARTTCVTDRGRREIGDLAAMLATCGVDRLVTSTFPRALESAGILAGHLALTPVRDDAWNELRPGDLSTVADADHGRCSSPATTAA